MLLKPLICYLNEIFVKLLMICASFVPGNK